MWATLLIILPAPVDTPAHVLPGDACVGAGVVRAETNILTVLIGVVTLEAPITVVTVRGHGKLPTFTAEHIPSFHLAGLIRWYTTELFIKINSIVVVRRSTTTIKCKKERVIISTHTRITTSIHLSFHCIVITSIIVICGILILLIWNKIPVTGSDACILNQ